jgi:AGCS family alanine or glycine:cation symporter
MAGGVTGISLVHAIRFGMARSVLATESGLGTAAVLFGFTGSQNGRESAYMGMVGAFMSTIVCFIVALCIVASGVANSGLNSTALTIEAYKTVFGSFAGLIISFLSIIFAIGVMVAYGYITRACFRVITGGRFEWLFILIYSGCAALGTVADIGKILFFGDVVLAMMLVINLAAVVFLLPQFSKQINKSR